MDATAVFWTPLITGPFAKFLVFIAITLFFVVNLKIAFKSFNKARPIDDPWPTMTKEQLFLPALGIALIFAFFLSSGLTLDWKVIQQYLNQVASSSTDPIFGKDISFYLFSFPLYHSLSQLLQVVMFLALAGCGIIYFFSRSFYRQGKFWDLTFTAKSHLTILAICFLLCKIWGYHLSRFGLLYQETARLTGISYTAEHANLLALNILGWLVAAIIVVLVFSLFHKNSLLLLGGLGLWLVASVLLGGVYPNLVQSLVVTPNEYELEAPYLQNHINLTRQAYDLDQITLKPFYPEETNPNTLNESHPSLANLRLWDYAPLTSSYNQLQSIRSYYEFKDIDLDRYPSESGQRQVMISARELLANQGLTHTKTWMNLHLVYTHGYGFAANQVNQFSEEGQPIFISKNIPPQTNLSFPALTVKRPEIYFGEATQDYIITNTTIKEFDYPYGDQNMSTTYQGSDGIPLDSILRKTMFALKYQEPNFILSNYLTKDSRILINRNVRNRVQKLAPFLAFDADPYLVVADQRLFWIIDGYTLSSYYPYSRRYSSDLNYIRNSVKAVVDAYNGTVAFYIVDETDPLIKSWQKVFPQLLQPLSAADPEIIDHFRYPEDLMMIQRELLCQYHMTDTKTFYLQEDYWNIPVHNQDKVFEPYYVTLPLASDQTGEFVMMQPFTPRNKQNLISWLVARCDPPHYGELILYTLPKDQNIYGPAQIDNRINQNEVISQLIALWNRNESKVVWGNLLIVPIDNSILYVKPLFLQSNRGQQAELKKIIMVYENQVLLGDTVAEALSGLTKPHPSNALNLVKPSEPTSTDKTPTGTSETRKKELLRQLSEHSEAIQQILEELQK